MLEQNENNLFCDRSGKPFIACGFFGVKISSVIGYNTKKIPDIF